MLRRGYSEVRKVHLVLDNLNTHLRSSFQEVLGKEAASSSLRCIQFHYTPVHASWLNMAEIAVQDLWRRPRLIGTTLSGGVLPTHTHRCE